MWGWRIISPKIKITLKNKQTLETRHAHIMIHAKGSHNQVEINLKELVLSNIACAF